MSDIQPLLPTRQRLLKATLLALLAATVILVVAVLPAEYGIDPTGLGKRMGLDALANSEAPASADAPAESSPMDAPAASAQAASGQAGAKVVPVSVTPTPTASPELDAVGQPAKPVDGSHVSKRSDAFRSDEMAITLAPGKGAEIKAAMQDGAGFVFRWTASAPVAVDMHGERKDAREGEYTSYWIERSLEQGSGSFTAPFEGSHGWYWLNRSDAPVTVKLQVTGFQQKLFRPGHE